VSDHLPSGWTTATLGDLADYINGAAFKPEDWGADGTPIIRIQNLTNPAKPLNRTRRNLDQRFLIRRGDLLFSWSATLDAFIWDREAAWLNQHIFKVVPHSNLVDPTYLYFLLRSEVKTLIASEHLHGSTMRHINRGPFLAHQIRLPPLPEQRRIVARIEALFARTCRARAYLERTAVLAKAYRRAAYRTAFTGELIQLSPSPTELSEDGTWDLPAGWRWARFTEVAAIASNLVAPAEIPDLLHLAPDNVESGTARLLPCKTVKEAGVISPKHHFFPGQIIYSKIRPYLRKAVLVDFEGACSADMYPLDVKPHVDKTYLLHWLISEEFAAFTAQHEGRTVLPKINQAGLSRTPVPLPPLEHQAKIGAALARTVLSVERTIAEATRALALVDRLEQSILTRAFRGELVPQDPNDEPASIRLERIKAGGEAEGKKPIRKRRQQPNRSKENSMKDKPVPARDLLLKDSEKWPKTGLPFEAIATRNFMPHDTLRDALFELLSGPSPALQQRFDSEAEIMVIQRVAA
jgi:type I restriction enzyme S subunit